jgi:hypothetical protein
MPSYSPNMKLCVICVRWAGPRQVNPTRSLVSTNESNPRGECLGGGHNRQQVPALATCHKYSKWEVLN